MFLLFTSNVSFYMKTSSSRRCSVANQGCRGVIMIPAGAQPVPDVIRLYMCTYIYIYIGMSQK